MERLKIIKIVSGGQTGADRAALDWAIKNGISHGGWCPKGRRAEDGPIDAKFQLKETLYGAEIHLLRQQMAEYLLNSRGLLMALCCRRDEHRRPDFDQPLDCQNSPAFQLRPRFGE
jgi:hypothetical protein